MENCSISSYGHRIARPKEVTMWGMVATVMPCVCGGAGRHLPPTQLPARGEERGEGLLSGCALGGALQLEPPALATDCCVTWEIASPL